MTGICYIMRFGTQFSCNHLCSLFGVCQFIVRSSVKLRYKIGFTTLANLYISEPLDCSLTCSFVSLPLYIGLSLSVFLCFSRFAHLWNSVLGFLSVYSWKEFYYVDRHEAITTTTKPTTTATTINGIAVHSEE